MKSYAVALIAVAYTMTSALHAEELTRENMRQIQIACSEDIVSVCGDVRRDREKAMQCIGEHSDKFSVECTSVLSTFAEQLAALKPAN